MKEKRLSALLSSNGQVYKEKCFVRYFERKLCNREVSRTQKNRKICVVYACVKYILSHTQKADI